MQRYDLIVCGAGPAGTMAAATAARAGLKVALLEKQVLPRHKTCGGGMPMVVERYLYDLAPEAFVESTVLYMRHTWDFEDACVTPINPGGSDRPLSIWMAQRPLFDNALAQQAVRAGAELRDGLAVRSIEVQPAGVRVHATGTGDRSRQPEFIAEADYLIGADGANGITAKVANLRQQRVTALAMEIEFPHCWGDGHPDLRPEIAHLEYNVRNGYAWAFPKVDHVNIGAILFPARRQRLPNSDNLAQELKQPIFGYLNALQLPYQPDQLEFHAHPLPIWSGKERLQTADGRILLAGDAAGLINPFFGDGILHAVKSGVIAANCIAAATPQQYSDRIHTEFAANMDAALNLARFFYQFPGVCYKYGVKHPQAARLATQLICGELEFTNILGRSVRRVRRSMVTKLLPT